MSQATFTTRVAQPQQAPNGRWCAAFENWVTHRGESYMSSSCTSAPLWFDADAARLAGERALKVLETTGRFPNMCELW